MENQEERKIRSDDGSGVPDYKIWIFMSFLSLHYRIMTRAYQLRDAREAERKKIIEEKLKLQWRDACDDARTLDSKAMTIYMNKERLRQIEEKKAHKQLLSIQENAFVDEWNRQMEKLAKRDADKQAFRQRIDNETSEAIKQQMNSNARLKDEFRQKTLQEEMDDLEKLRKEIELEEAYQRAKQEAAHARGRAVLEFNSQYKEFKEQENSIEREHDAILLDYALRKEHEKEVEEEMKRIANRNAAVQYRKYLEEQMIKEAEDTAFVDEIRKREEEKVWKARDDALNAREEARNYLLQQVKDGRQVQIQDKRAHLQMETQEGKVFADKFIRDAEEGKLKERMERERRRQIATENQSLLKQQMDYIKYKEEVEKQDAYLADKQMQYMERQHQHRLADQAGTVRANFPLMKNKWYS